MWFRSPTEILNHYIATNQAKGITMQYRYITSSAGQLLLAGNENGLEVIEFVNGSGVGVPKLDWQHNGHCFKEAEQQLNEYFAGTRKTFDLKLTPTGTEFQLVVFGALQSIPFGETRSYLQIAQQIGRPTAARAVGAANGKNPLPIVIPCHRVIGSDGSLTGFSGGLAVKLYLLELEGVEMS